MADSMNIDPARITRLRDPQRLEDINPELVWRAIEPQSDAVIVDVGAGVGFLTLPFAHHYPQTQFYACDILPGMLDLLQGSATEQSLTNIECLPMEDTRIPLGDRCADVVMMLQVHHELTNPQALLADCHRVLKPGGTLAIIDWKDEDNGKSPPAGRRVSQSTIQAQMVEAKFTELQSHPSYVYHNFITGKA